MSLNPESAAELALTVFVGEPTDSHIDYEVEQLDTADVLLVHDRLLRLDSALERRWKVLQGPDTERLTRRCARCGRTGM